MTEGLDGERCSDHATVVDGGNWPLRHPTARMRCRSASLSDAPAIAAIGREAFPATYAGTLAPSVIDVIVSALYTDDAVAADIRAARANPASRFLVIESGERANAGVIPLGGIAVPLETRIFLLAAPPNRARRPHEPWRRSC